MITESDKQAAEAFVRGEPIPPALEYTMLVEELEKQAERVRWLRKIGAISTVIEDAERELMTRWEAIERIKNTFGGRMPT